MKKTTSVISVLLALLMLFSVAASAGNGGGGGNGGGNGGGQSQNKPLAFISATVDGKDLADSTVSPTAAIKITFDRGMTDYQADNFANITILNDKNEAVSTDAYTLADFAKEETADSEGHQNTYTILTLKNLADGAYTLKLGKDLKANNGNTLGETVKISFTVKGESKDDAMFTTSGLFSFAGIFMQLIQSIIDFFAKLFG